MDAKQAPDEPLDTVDQVTRTWLTDALRRSGQLTCGEVRDIAVARVNTRQNRDVSYFLTVRYSPDSPDAVSRHLVLKIPRDPSTASGIGFSSGEREVRMYRTLMTDQARLPVVRCFSAAYDPATGRYHLLLEDLSDTHAQPTRPNGVTEMHVARTIDCLARLHAHWWGHASDDLEPPGYPSLADDPMRAHLREALPGFVDALGDRLSAEDRRLYERAIDRLPRLAAARSEYAEQTVVHGDAHFWNVLYSHDPEHADTRVLDWQTHHRGPAVEDLAYLLTLSDPHRTAERERAFLRRYQAALATHGVAMDWAALWEQYRNLVAEQMLVPLYWYSRGAPADFWPPHVPRVVAAARELRCEEML